MEKTEKDNNKEFEKLKKENKNLELELERYKSREQFNSKRNKWFFSKGINVFLGWRLNDSIKTLLTEIEGRKVKSETIGNVITHILWRLTRLGIIAFVIGILPGIFTFWQATLMKEQNKKFDFQNEKIIQQNDLMEKQNKKFDFQNEKIVQQNELMEGQRRSSYVFLLANVMENIKTELQSKSRLSKGLIGQILALSQALTPYSFYNGKTAKTEYYSPDKGILLMFILDAGIHKEDIDIILEQGDFNNLVLENYVFRGDTINNLICNNCKYDNVKFQNSLIDNLELNQSDINTLQFDDCKIGTLAINSMIQDALNAEIGIPSISDWKSLQKIRITNSQIDYFGTFLFNIEDLRVGGSEIATNYLDSIGFFQSYKTKFNDFNVEYADIIDFRVSSFNYFYEKPRSYADTIKLFKKNPRKINLEAVLVTSEGMKLELDEYYKKHILSQENNDCCSSAIILNESTTNFENDLNYIIDRDNLQYFLIADNRDKIIDDMSRRYSHIHWIGKYGATEVPSDTSDDEEKLFERLEHSKLTRKYRFLKYDIDND